SSRDQPVRSPEKYPSGKRLQATGAHTSASSASTLPSHDASPSTGDVLSLSAMASAATSDVAAPSTCESASAGATRSPWQPTERTTAVKATRTPRTVISRLSDE